MKDLLRFEVKGDLHKTSNLLNYLIHRDPTKLLEHYGKLGVERLREATPKATGLTANSWSYSVKKTSEGYTLAFDNSNRSEGIQVAVLIQYGHGTRGGTWVEGIDFINPALRPIFLELAEALRKEVANGTKN